METYEELGVQFLRLSTGEDVISDVLKVITDSNHIFILKDPLKVIYSITTKGVSVSLMQWIFSRVCDFQEFTLYPNDIITMAIPSNNMNEYYKEMVDHINKYKIKKTKDIEDLEEDQEDISEEGLKLLNEFMEKARGNTRGTLH